MKNLFPIIAAIGLAFTALASPPTQAWRRTFNTGSNTDFASSLDIDASGNAYMQYLSQSSGGHWLIHLVKVGPASGVLFDKVLDYTTAHRAGSILVSPLVAGKQYVYEFIYEDGTPERLTIYKFDTAGVVQWLSPFVYAIQANISVIGMYPDSSGNLLLALAIAPLSGGSLDMISVDTTGAKTSEHSNANITPSAAYYSSTLAGWIATGRPLDGTGNTDPYSAVWGVYDPTTGGKGTLGDAAQGSSSGFSSSIHSFLINALPGNAFSVAHNISNNVFTTLSYQTSLKVYNSAGTVAWQYPPSIAWGAYTMQLAQLNASAPYFMLSKIQGSTFTAPEPRLIDKFDNAGSFVWQHTHQPADLVFPWNDGGFFTAFYNRQNNTEYLEHADSNGVYDWGRGFPGTGSSAVSTLAGFKGFQNSFYFVNNLSDSGTSTDVVMDRFVTGIAMQSISTIFTSVKSGNSLNATIALNGNAPTGGVSVGVSSSSNKLLLPNGTQGQFITVPAGQPSVTVALSAQTVAVNTKVRILAIQNGIRRFVDVTVTP